MYPARHASPLPDFVLMSRQPWDKPLGSNIRDMARILARQHRVLFVNPAPDWRLRPGKTPQLAPPPGSETLPQKTPRLIEKAPNLWVLYPDFTLGSFNWLPDSFLYDWANRYNNELVARAIRRATAELNLESFVLLNDNDMFRGFYLKNLLRPAAYVYYLRDFMQAVPYWKRHGARLEPALMRRADLVASNSAYLAKFAAHYNPHSLNIGQGCDLAQFNPVAHHAMPPDLAAIPAPRVGYAGALTALRLDACLLHRLAVQRPNLSLVLIGEEDAAFRKHALHGVPNVHFLGPKPPAQIPAYLAHLDVLINPQSVNAVTVGNYPRKVDEYLAMGKPVVAVETETMALFRDHVLLSANADEFVTHIDKALAGQMPSTTPERITFAHQHTWEAGLIAQSSLNPLLVDTIAKLNHGASTDLRPGNPARFRFFDQRFGTRTQGGIGPERSQITQVLL